MTRSFDVFFDLRLNERLSKQSRGWWFETPSRPLWRQCDEYYQHPLIFLSTHIGRKNRSLCKRNFKSIFLCEIIVLQFHWNFVSDCPVNNKPLFIPIMDLRRIWDRQLWSNDGLVTDIGATFRLDNLIHCHETSKWETKRMDVHRRYMTCVAKKS